MNQGPKKQNTKKNPLDPNLDPLGIVVVNDFCSGKRPSFTATLHRGLKWGVKWKFFCILFFWGLIRPWFTPGLPGYLSMHPPSHKLEASPRIIFQKVPSIEASPKIIFQHVRQHLVSISCWKSIYRGITKNHLTKCVTAFNVYFSQNEVMVDPYSCCQYPQ